MTDAIAPTASVDLGGAASAAPAPAPNNPGAELDRDAFLKLLVAQLKYQDPTNPTDPAAMMAQTSQLTMVEKLDDIASALTAAAATDQLAVAGSMVGRNITFQADGGPQTGFVEAVRFVNGEFVLSAGGFAVPIAAVTEIRANGAAPQAVTTPNAVTTPSTAITPSTATPPSTATTPGTDESAVGASTPTDGASGSDADPATESGPATAPDTEPEPAVPTTPVADLGTSPTTSSPLAQPTTAQELLQRSW